ncbi:CRISPR-associated protein Cas4 [Candidatus Woesearchaeota archaeon]|nr:CRISPR-associated protein Cas4 [Candidatus Woesearchaeota archaeon]
MAKRISVTMLSAYLYCKRKLYLERVLGLFEPAKEALIKGSIRHATYEEINKIEEPLVKSITQTTAFKDIYDMYIHAYAKILRNIIHKNRFRLKTVKLPLLDAFKKIFPFFVRESKIRAENIFNFVAQNKIYGEDLWNSLTPKIKSEIKIQSDELELTGIIDRIEEYQTGSVPIELKTGSMPKQGVWPGHRIQIAAYALLLEEKFKQPIKEGFVHYLDQNEKRHIAINPFLKQEVKELKEKVRLLLNTPELPKINENSNKCKVCGLKDQCNDEKYLKTLLNSKTKALNSK